MEHIDSTRDELSIGEYYFTDLSEAVKEIRARQKDRDLLKKVEDFLNDDVPGYFSENKPFCYLARHVATPSFETLRFIEKAKTTNLPIVIGQDAKDKFVSHNSLKKSVAKMGIQKGVSHDGNEIIEYFTLIDFSTAQGKKLKDIVTVWGHSLMDLHVQLLNEIYPDQILITDDSEWIDRNNRGNLVEHYKKMLALTVVHSIMFETYPQNEHRLVKEALDPAFKFIENYFGVRPLIVNHIEPEVENDRNWEAYPSVCYQYVKKKFESIQK